MSNNIIFECNENDTTPVRLLKEELETACKQYKFYLKNHSSADTIICTFNHATLQRSFDKVCSLKEAILKLVDHNGQFIEI